MLFFMMFFFFFFLGGGGALLVFRVWGFGYLGVGLPNQHKLYCKQTPSTVHYVILGFRALDAPQGFACGCHLCKARFCSNSGSGHFFSIGITVKP